ncbi:MAG TPA: PTS sugar transporter subunit IIC [bacterium]|nr:PTS sugar transporter subunit IIC [bacterium]
MPAPLLKLAVLMSAAGALISLDENVLFRGMFAQPIACGSILGLLTGDLRHGVAVGAILQLLWLFDVPAGGFISIDYTSCTAVSTILMIVSLRAGMPEKTAYVLALPAFVLLGLLVGALSSHLMKRLRKFNEVLVERAIVGLEKGKLSAVATNNLMGLPLAFGQTFCLLLAATVGGGMLLVPVLLKIAPRIHGTCPWLAVALLAAGIGIGLRGLGEHHSVLFSLLSMAAAFIMIRFKMLAPSLLAALVILSCLIIFLLWQGLRPDER